MSETIRKVTECEVKKLDDRTFEFIASTEQLDRDGEVIEAKGWDLKSFKKNPVLMYGHDYKGLPIGRVPKIWIADGALKNHVEFPPEGTYEFADIVHRLVETGYLKAESVGFVPKEWVDGDGEKTPRRTHRKQELLEISIVPIPSNPDALIMAKSVGVITEKEYKLITKPEETEDFIHIRVREPGDFQDGSFRTIDIDKEKGIQAVIGRLKGETTTTVQKYIFAKSKGWTMESAQAWVKEHEKEMSDMEIKGAIAYHRTPLADEDSEWDAGKEVREAGVEDLKVMCAIVEGDPENKTSYKLPHHKAGGEHACVWRAVANCAAVLMGARGGVDAPVASIAGAKTHIGKHYDDFNKGEPPWEKGISQAEIKDELDFLMSSIKAQGLNQEAQETAWDLFREVMRIRGSDMPLDIAEKVGAVLNRSNLERLEQIRTLAQEVIDSAQHEEEPEKAVEPEITLADVVQIVKGEVSKAISKAQGRI